jgi:hypothetical protein
MNHRFSINENLDTCLQVPPETFINLGYNSILKFPVVLWIHNLQTTRENIFSNFQIISGQVGDCEDLTTTIEAAMQLANKLPLTTKEFNRAIMGDGFGYFYAGSNQFRYTFSLQNQGNLSLEGVRCGMRARPNEAATKFFDLSPEDSAELAVSYVDFVRTHREFAQYQTGIDNLIESLRKLRS